MRNNKHYILFLILISLISCKQPIKNSSHRYPEYISPNSKLIAEKAKTGYDSLICVRDTLFYHIIPGLQIKNWTPFKDSFFINDSLKVSVCTQKGISLFYDTVNIKCDTPFLSPRTIIFKYPFAMEYCSVDNEVDSSYTDFPDLIGIDENLSDRWLENLQFDSDVVLHNNWYDRKVFFFYDYFKINFTLFNTIPTSHLPYFNNCFFNGISFNDNGSRFGTFDEDIHSTIFNVPIEFSRCFLNKTVDLSGCQISKDSHISLINTSLPDTLDISNVKLNGVIDLLSAYPNLNGHKCQIITINTDVSKLKMQYQNFHLYIPNDILNSEKTRDIVSATYESLLNNFKKNGFTESYRQLDIEYKEWQSKSDITLVLSDWWWKFGYEKWRILLITLLLIIVFSILNYIFFKKLQTVYPIEKLNDNYIYYSNSKWIVFLKKYFASLIYTGLIFFRFSIDFKNINFKSFRCVAFLILQYVIGLVCTGFLINWILKG
jgi:hypothetical protein